MDPKAIYLGLQAKFGEDAVYGLHDEENKRLDSWLFAKADQILPIMRHLRDTPDLGFDYLECLSGVDTPDHFVVVYHLFSYTHKHRVVVKATVPRESPSIDSVCGIWSAANWQERECYDLVGITFNNHPDLRRLLLPDDWEGHPLRKDYVEKPMYHGIPTSRPSPLELLSVKIPPKEPAKPAEPPAKADAPKDKVEA